jgi:circadian clock protein KaiC
MFTICRHAPCNSSRAVSACIGFPAYASGFRFVQANYCTDEGIVMTSALATDLAPEIVPTRIAALDTLLGGGIPRRSLLLIAGDAGSGKTVLAAQIAFAQAALGATTVFTTVTSETNDKLASHLRGFKFFDENRLGNEFFLISGYPWLEKGPAETKDRILRVVRERGASFLVLDGLRPMRDLWEKESEIRNFYYELGVGLAQLNATGIMTAQYSPESLDGIAEATTVDGIIALSQRELGESAVRRIQVMKLRGRAHLAGEHVFQVSKRGLAIIPRLETTVPSAPEHRVDNNERAEFGISALDELIGGGLPVCSTTLLSGGTGTGKSLIALAYAATGAGRGEPALFVSHSETADELTARARAVGFDIASQVERGALSILYRPLIETEADHVADEILKKIKALGIRRLVIDGVGELESGISNPDRGRAFFTALIGHLRHLGVTTLFTKLDGTELDSGGVSAENVLLLSRRELDGTACRVLSILKMRASPFDDRAHELTIDDRGIHLMSAAETARPRKGGPKS